MIPSFIDKSSLPHKPGIYMHKDREGNILYVGKAVDLYSRVASYFSGSINSFKTAHMVERIASIETIVVESELEALILEANLIKKYLPPYNIRLTDDKDYLYIVVTKEAFPSITTGRKKDVREVKKYYGPFPSSRTVKDTLKKLRRVFPWCSNPPRVVASRKSQESRGNTYFSTEVEKYNHDLTSLGASQRVGELANQENDNVPHPPTALKLRWTRSLLPKTSSPQSSPKMGELGVSHKQEGERELMQDASSLVRQSANSLKKQRACFYYHLKLCPGASVEGISQEEYNKIINRFIRFMEDGKAKFVDQLTREMNEVSKQLDYEEAARIKKIITGVEYMTSSTGVSKYLENHNFLEDERQKALEQLQNDLKLAELPERIECYDISNFQGTDATGSMVVLTNGEIDKSQYRKFKIKISGKPDDFAMHAEMMRRRLKHSEWGYPQLFLIDGGRGQVRAAYEEIQKFGLANQRVSESASKQAKEDLLKEKEVMEQASSLDRQSASSLLTIPVFGLAKREEWLYPPEGEVLKLPKRSLSLRLLQKIRDESHRFAITYHRKLRKRSAGY